MSKYSTKYECKDNGGLASIAIACVFIVFAVVMMSFIHVWRSTGGDKSDSLGLEDVTYDIMEFFSEEKPRPTSKIAIACLMRKPIDLHEWFKHHINIGISHFFIRVEDSGSLGEYLSTQKNVTVEIGDSDTTGNNYHTLQYRQRDYVNKCIKDCQKMGIEWLFHIDADELLNGSLAFLDNLDKGFKCVRLQNAEAVFKENESSCFSALKFMKCGKGAPCRSYVNGKGGGRIAEGVALMGPHHFGFNGEIHGKSVYEVPFEKLHVLHFDSCSFGAWVEKFNHLSKKKQENIPFPYYNESINAAVKGYEVYKRFNMSSLDGIDPELVYQRADV